MKTGYLMLGVSMLGLSLPTLAERYEFIAGDATTETKICMAAVTDNKRGLKQAVKELKAVGISMKREYLRMKIVANSLKCNDDYVANFANKYDASNTYQYLNRYTHPSKRLNPTTSIKDITARNESESSNKVIQILVASR